MAPKPPKPPVHRERRFYQKPRIAPFDMESIEGLEKATDFLHRKRSAGEKVHTENILGNMIEQHLARKDAAVGAIIDCIHAKRRKGEKNDEFIARKMGALEKALGAKSAEELRERAWKAFSDYKSGRKKVRHFLATEWRDHYGRVFMEKGWSPKNEAAHFDQEMWSLDLQGQVLALDLREYLKSKSK